MPYALAFPTLSLFLSCTVLSEPGGRAGAIFVWTCESFIVEGNASFTNNTAENC